MLHAGPCLIPYITPAQNHLSSGSFSPMRSFSPALKTGATSKIRSVYVRDPDLNLVEISVPA